MIYLSKNEIKVKILKMVVPFSIFIFLFLSFYNIHYPGLYYDEMLFVNAALGGHSDLFIHKKIFQVPISLMPYIGALKAWLYYPIFKFFDVSAISVRLPMIFIGAATLYLNYRIVKLLFGLTAAYFFIILASVEPSTILHTRFDWGPTALMMLFRASLLLSLLLWIRSKNDNYMIYIALSFFFGIFDKLNFIWIIAASFISFACVYPNDFFIFVDRIRRSLTKIISFFILFIMTFLLLKQVRISGEIEPLNFFTRGDYVYKMILGSISGDGVYSFITGMQNAFGIYQLYIFSLIAFLSAGIVLFLRSKNDEVRSFIFILIFILLVLFQLFFTKQATGPHHIATIAPFWLILISAGLSQFYNLENKKYAIHFFVLASCFLLFISSLVVTLQDIRGIKSNPRARFDPASYNLSSEIIKTKIPRVVCVDWGTATIIQGLTQDKLKIIDYWPIFNDKFTSNKERWLSSSLLDGNTLFIVSAEKVESFPDTRIHFLDFIRKNSEKIKLYKLIFDSSGRPLYEIYI